MNGSQAKGPEYWGALALLSTLAGCASLAPCGLKGCADDRDISARVQALFDQSPTLEAPNQVTVQTVNHVVYLRGIVDTPYQRQLAQSLAEQADAGGRVINMIGLNNNSM